MKIVFAKYDMNIVYLQNFNGGLDLDTDEQNEADVIILSNTGQDILNAVFDSDLMTRTPICVFCNLKSDAILVKKNRFHTAYDDNMLILSKKDKKIRIAYARTNKTNNPNNNYGCADFVIGSVNANTLDGVEFKANLITAYTNLSSHLCPTIMVFDV